MNINIDPNNGMLQINDARICYKNFRGEASKFNRAGDRNFSVIIEDEEVADALTNEGWNVKVKPPREDGDTPFMTLPVKVKFNERGPIVYLKSGNATNKLYEDTIACLDEIEIDSIDMDIRPYDWVIQEGTPNEKRGRSAYLQSIWVNQRITDRFAHRYEAPASATDDEEWPF